MKCALCDQPGSRIWYEVLGEQVTFCAAHGAEWDKIGAMATMIAFVLQRLDQKKNDSSVRIAATAAKEDR